MAKWTCCIPSCRNYKSGRAPPGTSWHAFPKNEVYRQAWTVIIEKHSGGSFKKLKHARVCGLHFNHELDYRSHLSSNSKFKGKLLKKDALPSVFNVDNDLIKMPTKSDSDKGHSLNHNESMTGLNGRSQLYNNNNNNNTPHSQSMEPAYHSMTMNGNADYDGVSTTNGGMKASSGGRSSPAESDTYELTELTPMGKQDRLTPISPAALYRPTNTNDPSALYHRSGSIITANSQNYSGQHGQGHGQQHQQHMKEAVAPVAALGGNVGPLESSSMLNGTDIATYADAFKKCVISESFLYTLLRLVKCPQCGFGVNSEQMLKYESQGCLLGVRLPCYSGHLVLDWRL